MMSEAVLAEVAQDIEEKHVVDDPVLEPLMARPDLPQLAERLQEYLEQERIAREKFREELTPEMKAEFIQGAVIVHSPAKNKHLEVSGRVYRLMGTFVDLHQLGTVHAEKALVALTRNDYEPDICYFGIEKTRQFTPDQLKFPAPDLVVEVLSETTEQRDRGIKFQDYAAHGIAEYWIIDCDQRSIEQYLIDEASKEYRLVQKVIEGEIESNVISGFRIPVAAIFNNERQIETLKKFLM